MEGMVEGMAADTDGRWAMKRSSIPKKAWVSATAGVRRELADEVKRVVELARRRPDEWRSEWKLTLRREALPTRWTLDNLHLIRKRDKVEEEAKDE